MSPPAAQPYSFSLAGDHAVTITKMKDTGYHYQLKPCGPPCILLIGFLCCLVCQKGDILMLPVIAEPFVCGHENPDANSVVQLVEGGQDLLVKKKMANLWNRFPEEQNNECVGFLLLTFMLLPPSYLAHSPVFPHKRSTQMYFTFTLADILQAETADHNGADGS